MEGVVPEMRAALHRVNPLLHFRNPTSLDKPLSKLHLDREGFTLLIGFFANLALFLSAIGMFGVIAYEVQQRRREFGIRVAIGAGRSTVLSMVLRQGVWKTIIGLGLGLLASVYFTRFLESSLFDLSALDLSTYVITSLLVFLVALIAIYVPARRAIRVDPMESLESRVE